MINKVYLGDCLEVLKTLEESSVDSIVTDPPYELGFMGKSWDNTGIANNKEMWREAMRVLKPGGHLLAFSGTRTYHRMAVAIEDAGFEVRDMIEWVYGSGFPKSRNIGLDVDKRNGVTKNRGKAFVVAGQSGQRDKDTGGDLVPGSNTMGAYVAQNEWSGWGTALKPAHEPICMARKPLAEKTVARNVLKYGTGGINIDESRVGTEQTVTRGRSKGGTYDIGLNNPDFTQTNNGRFPANLIHNNSEEVRECFPEAGGGKYKAPNARVRNNGLGLGTTDNRDGSSNAPDNYGDSGNASRFFKSIKKDLQYSPKHAILKLCENNISVNNAENNLKTTSQIELVANIFSALKSATPNLDLLNQKLNALFVEKSADSTEIDFVAKCVAIKELPEELVSQQEYTVFQDFMEDYKKCSLTQNPVSAEKLGNTDITQIMTSLLKLSGYVLAVIEENISSENQEGQKCDYRSLVYIPKASKSERNKGCEELEEKERIDYGGFHSEKGLIENNRNPENRKPTTNNHPTVKPLELMSYLIKMVTPKGGIVLDPFAGSGSTLVAAKQNGFNYIGIEMTEEYIPIIEARLK